MNIAVLSFFPPSNTGGAEIVWKNLAKEQDFDLTFITIGKNKENNLDHKVISLPGPFSKIPTVFHLSKIIAAPFLWKEVQKRKYDLIIYDNIFGWPKVGLPTRKICIDHGSYALPGEYMFKEKNPLFYAIYKNIIGYFEKRSFGHASVIVCVSENEKQEIMKAFSIPEEKIIVIPNGIDPAIFRPMSNKKTLREKYNLPQDKFILFFGSARASYGKGYDIAKEIVQWFQGRAHLIVPSEGKSEDHITFIGQLSHEAMAEAYNLSDIVLFPSRYEGFGMVPIEAAFCGTPSLVSPVGVFAHQPKIDPYTLDTIQEFIQRIEKFLDNPSYLKEAAKVWKQFSQQFTLRKQIEAYKKLMIPKQ